MTEMTVEAPDSYDTKRWNSTSPLMSPSITPEKKHKHFTKPAELKQPPTGSNMAQTWYHNNKH